MDPFWLVVYTRFVSTALLTHLVVAFYAKQFEWSDLQGANLGRNVSNCYFSNIESMDTFWVVVCTRFVSTALLTHLVVVFYAKQFEWSDLQAANLRRNVCSYYNTSQSTCFKALVCGCSIGLCRHGWISVERGRLLILVLAIPQLYRFQGLRSQQLRIVMGPLTPILALHNTMQSPADLANISMATACLLAFVILRPDNTAVLDLLLRLFPKACLGQTFLSEAKTRRQFHGILAACNATLALTMVLIDHFGNSAASTLDNFRTLRPQELSSSQ